MSYFRRHDAHVFDAEQCAVEDEVRAVEIADGVTVERRSVLWLSAASIGAMLAATPRLAGQHPQATSAPKNRLTFEQFLAEIYPLTRRVVESRGADEEAYLMTVAAAMSRIGDPAAPLRKAMRAFRQQHAQSGERFPLMAVSVRLKPGRGFRHHDHLDYNGVIMGIDGEVRIRNYDFLDEAPALESDETFRIRETRNDLILPGRMSTLGRNRDNIHDLVAGKKGAHVLDVFTFFAKHAGSRYLDVAPEPRDAEARIYDAAWKSPNKSR